MGEIRRKIGERARKRARKAKREKSLLALRGRKFARLSRAEKDALLLLLLERADVVDENGVVK